MAESRTTIRQKIFISTVSLLGAALGLTAAIYLVLFSDSSSDLIEHQAREINKQIVFNFERYIESIIETGNYIQNAVSYDVLYEKSQLEAIFRLNNEIKKDLVSAMLFDLDGNRLLGDTLRFQSPNLVREQPWFIDSLSIPEIYHFSVGISSNRDVNRNDSVMVISRLITMRYGGQESSAVLFLEFNTESITELSINTNLGTGGHLLIIDDENTLVYSSSNDNFGRESLAIVSDAYMGSFRTKILDQDMYIHINTLTNTRWRIVTVSNISDINQTRVQILTIVSAIFVASLILTSVIAGFISVRISRPIQQLKNYMLVVEQGDFSSRIVVEGQQEIVQLAGSFNQMISQIRNLMDRLLEEQREKRKTELRALQNQINPHFLYNTLDSIVWLAEHRRSDDVITTVVALAKFFRISISRGENFIPVKTELEHAENYLTIQQIRYVDRFTYHIDVQPEMLDIKIMKLILQPIVENAIHHGLGDEKGSISIHGWVDSDVMIFEVINTGYGLTDNKIEQILRGMRQDGGKNGVGLRNVYQRLKLYYGELADISFSSKLDESTTVRLIIPIKPTQEESV